LTILVDSNVIIDILTADRIWREWSEAALTSAADRDEIAINPIIYAEIASGFATMADLDRRIGVDAFRRLALPYEAAFVAGRAFVEYRRRGGARTSPLPDFYIGAHAAVAGLELLTRDARRYAGYFPKVLLISPDRARHEDIMKPRLYPCPCPIACSTRTAAVTLSSPPEWAPRNGAAPSASKPTATRT
jgi:predicted nucleic acid-binding protein